MQSTTKTDVVRFGIFEADLRSGELHRNGVKVKIQELPFRALRLLVSRPNEVLSREEIRQALWPDGVFVDFDRGITSAINRLRDALGDSADNPVFVETVGRRGYRWIAPTHSPQPTRVTQPQVDPVAKPPATSPQWKWILVLPVLALLFSVWIFRPGSHSAKAGDRMPVGSVDSGFSHRAANREAEDYYLKGRFYWEKRTPESLNQAVDSFTQAIVHDPNYAQAYVGLADCYNLLREYTAMPASEAYPRALAAAKKAVELDSQSSQAHASLAFVSFYGMWDVQTADHEFRRAIELNPNNATAHHWYATYLEALYRLPESLEEIERAQAIDPSSRSILADKGRILTLLGRREESASLLQHMETTEPDFVSPPRYMKFVYLETGDYPHYLAEMKKEAHLVHDNAALVVADAAEKGFATGGKRGMLENMRREQKKLYDRGQLRPYILAQTCALLGDKKQALQYLKAAYEKRSDELSGLRGDELLNNLHAEPEFQKLLAQVGLPPL